MIVALMVFVCYSCGLFLCGVWYGRETADDVKQHMKRMNLGLRSRDELKKEIGTPTQPQRDWIGQALPPAPPPD